MYRIELIQGNSTTYLNAEDGQKLSDILMFSGADFQHPCACKGRCGKCTVSVNGKKELSCRYVIKSDITVVIPETNLSEIRNKTNTVFTENVNVVIDIGTTTIEGVLTDKNGNISESLKILNPQKIFGSDVISRCAYAAENGTEKLQNTLIAAINNLSSRLLDSYGLTAADNMYISGNTVMLHTFFGEDCKGFTKSPYSPVFLASKSVSALSHGIKTVKNITSLPCISAFVGADIVAGLNFAEKPQKNRFNLLIDLGTNAEIVLYSGEKTICTAAAAGPCFEGANISCGMSATDGAVYSFSYGYGYRTINNKKPIGICATGLIDIVAELIKNDLIDESGHIGKSFVIHEDIALTQDDIRQFQLAKSAVYSAIRTLISKAGISFRDIDRCYITGGFSEKLNISNAVITGLIPIELQSKIELPGNSSLKGAIKYATEQNNLSALTDNAFYCDLSSDEFFADQFVANMQFGTL